MKVISRSFKVNFPPPPWGDRIKLLRKKIEWGRREGEAKGKNGREGEGKKGGGRGKGKKEEGKGNQREKKVTGREGEGKMEEMVGDRREKEEGREMGCERKRIEREDGEKGEE